MKPIPRTTSLQWGNAPQFVIEAELKAQDDMAERGRRLREAQERKEANAYPGKLPGQE